MSDWTRAATLCQERYERSRDPQAGLLWARALNASRRWDAAMRVAGELLDTPVRLQAYGVLATAAQGSDDLPTWKAAARKSFEAHLATGNNEMIARAAHGLAGALLSGGELAEADYYEEMAIAKAIEISNPELTLFFTLGRADILRQRGDGAAAERLLAAVPVPRDDFQAMWFLLKRGILYVSRTLHEPALADLHDAATLAKALNDVAVERSVLLNLAWISRMENDVEESLRYISAAQAVDAGEQDVHFLRGLALLAGHRYDEAAAELGLAQQAVPQGQWSWTVPYYLGQALQALGDEVAALAAYETSALAVRALIERAGSHIPEVAASHREPYQRLLGLHAGRGDWQAAFELVMRLDTLSLLASEKLPAAAGRPGESVTAHPAPPLIFDPPPVAEVVEAWRGRHLVVLASDEQTMWRLEVQGGEVRGAAVGVAAELEELASQLAGNPGDRVLASRLGEALLPARSAPANGSTSGGSNGATIDVLLIGSIGGLPLPALRQRGELFVAHAPLARVLGVLPRRAPAAARRGALVVGDPSNDLPRAREEAAQVASLLGVSPFLGRAATSTVFAAARGKQLVHAAGHSRLTGDGGILHLADRAIGRADICRLSLAPAVMVLASCGAAAARDDAGWGSLAAAFLDAGSDAVIAASSDVEDSATSELMRELYRHDVAAHPAKALARTQVAMSAGLAPRAWSAFEVLRAPPDASIGGVEECRP